jgi:hypothetical protein
MEHSSINLKPCLYFIHSKFEEKKPIIFKDKFIKKFFLFLTVQVKTTQYMLLKLTKMKIATIIYYL